MKVISLFSLILKQTHTRRYLTAFVGFFLVATLLLWLTDPDLHSWWDAIWYGFMLVTTIGFGDLKATTLVSRLISVVLGLNGILTMGFLCGVGASWLFETVRLGQGESIARMLDQLEHLEDLDDDQIDHLSRQISRYDPSKEIEPPAKA